MASFPLAWGDSTDDPLPMSSFPYPLSSPAAYADDDTEGLSSSFWQPPSPFPQPDNDSNRARYEPLLSPPHSPFTLLPAESPLPPFDYPRSHSHSSSSSFPPSSSGSSSPSSSGSVSVSLASFDPGEPADSFSSTVFPPPSPASSLDLEPPVPKRRRAAAGGGGEAEAGAVEEPIKRSHRQLDADRRRKESEALKRLDQLTGSRELKELTEAGAVRKAKAKKKRTADAKRREKLTVLESSIAHIERLQALVDRLTDAGDAKERRMQELTHHLRSVAMQYAQLEQAALTSVSNSASSSTTSISALSLLSSPTASYLDNQHALYSSIFLSSGLMMMLMDLDTAVIIDANSRFVHLSGFSREGVIGKRINGKGAHDTAAQQHAAHYAIVKVRDRSAAPRQAQTANGDDCDTADDDDLPWIDAPMVRQYPSSLQCLQELREGRRESFRAPWRCVMADGRLVEVESMCVVARRQWVVEADGRAWERPSSLLVANGWTDSVPVDGSRDELN